MIHCGICTKSCPLQYDLKRPGLTRKKSKQKLLKCRRNRLSQLQFHLEVNELWQKKWQLKKQSRIIKFDPGEVGFLSFFAISFEVCRRFYNEAKAKQGSEQNGVQSDTLATAEV